MKWKVTDQDAERTYAELVKLPPTRAKPKTSTEMMIDAPATSSLMNDFPPPSQSEQKLLNMEGGMLDLRDKLIVLAGKQEETTATANRLAEDLQQTLKIITDQQHTLKQHGEIIKARQDQLICHQEWIDSQQQAQGGKVNTGRLFQDQLRDDMAECAREVLKVEAAHQNAWSQQSEVNLKLIAQQQETMQAAQEWYTTYHDWESRVPKEKAPFQGKQDSYRRNSTGQCQEWSGSSVPHDAGGMDDVERPAKKGNSNDRYRDGEKKPILIPPVAAGP